MTLRSVTALGVGQCINWGVLYYAFAVLVLPVERDLGAPTWVVTGAFSLALLVSALAAPTIGRLGDRGHAPALMFGGGVLAAALLVLWTIAPGVATLYVVWAGLGLCMAATLYEPAFVVVGRAFDDPSRRLRALALVTLFGGLASTLFLPLTAFLVTGIGWRGAVVVLASALLVSAVMAWVFAFRGRRATAASPRLTTEHGSDRAAPSSPYAFIAATFAMTSLTSAAFTANLLPALGERGVDASTAAVLGGLMGVMQLPGRALLLHGAIGSSPMRLLGGSLGLHSAGLVAVALGPSVPVVAAGTMLFALGAGLTTLVRPHLVQMLFSGADSGAINGRIARQQQLARAAGPLGVAWFAGATGYGAVLVSIAGVFAAMAVASWGTSAKAERPLTRCTW